MNRKKDLLPQAIRLNQRITVKNLPVDLVELSKEDLQQIIGGRKPIVAKIEESGGVCGPRCNCRLNE